MTRTNSVMHAIIVARLQAQSRMKNYIDESGTFGWTPEGVSLFAGLSIADRSLPKIVAAFYKWRRGPLGLSDDVEVKGATLTPEQLAAFAKWVVLPHRDFWITLTGADTRNTKKAIVTKYVEQAAEVADAAAKLADQRRNESLARDYRNMARWIYRRSPQNGLWLAVLSRGILRTMQHTIGHYMQPTDDAEFEEWDIVIDRSFIHTSKHLSLWGEWLRSSLYQETNKEPLDVPVDWATRNHPFVRKYLREGDVLDMSDLFRNHTRFADSKEHEGLQMADVCAAICRRFFADDLRAPYELIWPRIVRDDHANDILWLHLNETSLRQVPPESAIKFFDPPTDDAVVDE